VRCDKRGKNGLTTISHLHSRGRTSIRSKLKAGMALIALVGKRPDGRVRGLSFRVRRNSIEAISLKAHTLIFRLLRKIRKNIMQFVVDTCTVKY